MGNAMIHLLGVQQLSEPTEVRFDRETLIPAASWTKLEIPLRFDDTQNAQGNLDPTLLLGPMQRLFAQAEDILERVNGRPGHIFNLGHGILPSTPVEHVQMLAQYVHSAARRGR